MPSRLIREGIIDSERIDKLDWPEEVFYRRLMSKVDDHGLFDARLKTLRTGLYPLRVDRVREADIARWIAACETAGVIALYEHGGKPYGQMADTRWQARSQPKYPVPPWGKDAPPVTHVSDGKQPPSDGKQLPAAVHSDVVVGVVGDDKRPPQASPVAPTGKTPKAEKGSKRCPESFAVGKAEVLWAKKHAPGVDVPRETIKFRNHTFRAARSDWPATWQNWILEAADRQAGRPAGSSAKSFREMSDDAAAETMRGMTGGLMGGRDAPESETSRETLEMEGSHGSLTDDR